MGVNETMRTSISRRFNLPVTGCVINRMTPDLDHYLFKLEGKTRGKMCLNLKQRY